MKDVSIGAEKGMMHLLKTLVFPGTHTITKGCNHASFRLVMRSIASGANGSTFCFSSFLLLQIDVTELPECTDFLEIMLLYRN